MCSQEPPQSGQARELASDFTDRGPLGPLRFFKEVAMTKKSANRSKGVGSGPALPRHWDEIDAGHLVLAQDADPKEGWWPAIVLEKNGDMFTLRWQAFPQQKKVLRHQFNVGLMYPGAAVEDHGSKAEPSSAS